MGGRMSYSFRWKGNEKDRTGIMIITDTDSNLHIHLPDFSSAVLLDEVIWRMYSKGRNDVIMSFNQEKSMGFDLKKMFEELYEILDSEMRSAKKLKALQTAIVAAKKRAENSGRL
jgi:hypothetical protein